MYKLFAWIKNARYQSLPQSVFPALAAIVMAWPEESFSLPLSLCALLGVMMAHLASNLADDYSDYRHNEALLRSRLSAHPLRKEKCAYLFSGEYRLSQLRRAMGLFALTALCLACVIGCYRGLPILCLILLTAFLGWFYSGAPLRLSYHGMGEALIGLIFGPLLMSGVYYSACGQWSHALLWTSVSVGLLVFNIVYTHAVMDAETDDGIGKRTLAVVFPQLGVQLFFSFIANFFPFIWMEIGCCSGLLPFGYHMVWIAFPMAVVLFYLIVQHFRHPERTYAPKWWMGPMPVKQWEAIRQLQLDAFMLRWFLARNLTTLFCLLLILVAVCGMLFGA